ncbi:MAG: GTP-binding protein [Herbaspirillum sp.]|jgi:G3E family GTPase|nr:GTP-binding protein [Herbaspirillum sp.]
MTQRVIREVPIILLTGFLGSGKTTLLRQMLTLPGWSDTVVLVNELGTVGLDHHLLGTVSDAVVLMENGCICCSVRDDLLGMLEELFWKRLQRRMPRFTRVVIETTGLADPGPIIGALRSHALIAERYILDGVLCTVDAIAGAAQLEQHPESVAQAAAADVILITKTDCDEARDSSALEATLRSLNPLALLQQTVPGQLSPGFLNALSTRDRTQMPAAPHSVVRRTGAMRYLHHGRVQTTTLRFTRPWEWSEFEQALRATVAQYGERLLRIKGWLDVAGESGPVVVQAVGQTVFPVEKLAAWPAPGKRDSFVVCISTGLTADAVAAAFRSHMAHSGGA